MADLPLSSEKGNNTMLLSSLRLGVIVDTFPNFGRRATACIFAFLVGCLDSSTQEPEHPDNGDSNHVVTVYPLTPGEHGFEVPIGGNSSWALLIFNATSLDSAERQDLVLRLNVTHEVSTEPDWVLFGRHAGRGADWQFQLDFGQNLESTGNGGGILRSERFTLGEDAETLVFVMLASAPVIVTGSLTVREEKPSVNVAPTVLAGAFFSTDFTSTEVVPDSGAYEIAANPPKPEPGPEFFLTGVILNERSGYFRSTSGEITFSDGSTETYAPNGGGVSPGETVMDPADTSPRHLSHSVRFRWCQPAGEPSLEAEVATIAADWRLAFVRFSPPPPVPGICP